MRLTILKALALRMIKAGGSRESKKVKIAVCPKCEAGIEYLQYSGRQSWSARYFAGRVYELDQEFAEFGDEQWSCPKCHKVLFTNECLADGFLRGKVMPAKILSEERY